LGIQTGLKSGIARKRSRKRKNGALHSRAKRCFACSLSARTVFKTKMANYQDRRAYLSRLVVSALAVFLFAMSSLTTTADPGPMCPTAGTKTIPVYGSVGGEPNWAVWQGIELPADGCGGLSTGAVKLVVSLAGQFEFGGTVEALAERIGAISKSKGMLYWSVTDGRMRELLADSFAISNADTKAERKDFSSEEVLSGKRLLFAQDDTRSTGINIYSLETQAVGRDFVTFDVVNENPIKLGPVTLFAPHSIKSRHFFTRISSNVWGYYGLTLVEKGQVSVATRSLINRGIALYKHLTQ
jgi:Family of unknown function (DUF6675)